MLGRCNARTVSESVRRLCFIQLSKQRNRSQTTPFDRTQRHSKPFSIFAKKLCPQNMPYNGGPYGIAVLKSRAFCAVLSGRVRRDAKSKTQSLRCSHFWTSEP